MDNRRKFSVINNFHYILLDLHIHINELRTGQKILSMRHVPCYNVFIIILRKQKLSLYSFYHNHAECCLDFYLLMCMSDKMLNTWKLLMIGKFFILFPDCKKYFSLLLSTF